ncbi:MAG: hypothetical protein M1816_001444 [Peltula sp. TS41687]|nr:MAG: hypothetical protein M1816_001444 [Peltula sp. TS41687]
MARASPRPYLPSGARSHQVPPRYLVAAASVQTDAAAVATLPANRRAVARTALAAAGPPWALGWTGSIASATRSTLRFQELLLARLDSLESAYRAAHGQPAAISDDDETDNEGDDDGDAAGDGDGSSAAGAGAGDS